jgi:DNA polymerase-3 subunit epsilon
VSPAPENTESGAETARRMGVDAGTGVQHSAWPPAVLPDPRRWTASLQAQHAAFAAEHVLPAREREKAARASIESAPPVAAPLPATAIEKRVGAEAPRVELVELPLEAWTDGSGTTADQPAGIGVVISRGGLVLCEVSDAIGAGTSNQAELRAIARALTLARQVAGSRDVPLRVCSDSQFALGAIGSDRYQLKAEHLVELVESLRLEVRRWPRIELRHVAGHSGVVLNERADQLAGRARKSQLPAPLAPDLVWIDTETTGLDAARHQMIELAAVVTSPDAATVRRAVCRKILLEPWAEVDAGALAINGYDPRGAAWKREARPLGDVMAAFAAWLPERFALAGHNVPFDRRFVLASFARAGLPRDALGESAVDTKRLAQRLVKAGQIPNTKLESLCRHFGVSNDGAHTALADTHRAIEVYRRLRAAEAAQAPGLFAEAGGAS